MLCGLFGRSEAENILCGAIGCGGLGLIETRGTIPLLENMGLLFYSYLRDTSIIVFRFLGFG